MLQLVLQVLQVLPMFSVVFVGYLIDWLFAAALLVVVPAIWWTMRIRRRSRRLELPGALPAAEAAQPHPPAQPQRPPTVSHTGTVSHPSLTARPDDDTNLERLHEDVVSLAHASLRLDPIQLMPDIKRATNRAMMLINERRYPRQLDKLHLLASMSLCVAADNDLNLGNRQRAADRVQLARAYAENIEHRSLQAWCCSFQSWLLTLDGLPQRAARMAVVGQELATTAIAKRRLHGMHGNALALMDDKRGAQREFDLARVELPSVAEPDDLIDRVGGMFGAPLAKQCQNAAYGLTRLELFGKAAVAAEKAIYLYSHGPADQRDYVLEAGARVSLAISYVKRRQLGAASETLRPTFALPPNRRADYIRMLMADLQRILVESRFNRSSEAAKLRAELEEFTLNGRGQ